MNAFLKFCGRTVILSLLTIGSYAAERQTLHGHIPSAVSRLQPIGRLSGSTNLHLAIGLPLRNAAALSNLLAQIYDPSSPQYRHYLTPEQFAERFGPSEADYQAVIAFAKTNNFRVTTIHPNRVLVDVEASAADIERALHIRFNTYRHPTENRIFYAPDSEPSLNLNVPVLHVSGLDNYSLPRPCLQSVRPLNGEFPIPDVGSGSGGSYMGYDFRAAYAPGVSLDGSGQSVGLLEFESYDPTDGVDGYESQAGLPNVTLTNVLVDGGYGPPDDDTEASLDIEMAISMAPGLSNVIVYEAPEYEPWVDILNRMATDNLAKQLSCSWYQPNGSSNAVADQIFQQMAAQGQTFFAASGDFDAYSGLIPFPDDNPYITIVGGTTLTTAGPGSTWLSETVWNDGQGDGSGGGISTQYPIPAWQNYINMVPIQGSSTMRNIPDVALTANNVFVGANYTQYVVNGTSCSAPLWAGFTALVNQEATAVSRPPLGFLNPALYSLGAQTNYPLIYHDITTGNNTNTSSPTMFYAAPGYDLCTGWGTPAGQLLIDSLALPVIVTVPVGVNEGAGLLAGAGHIQLPRVLSTNIVVTLTTSDPAQVSLPASVTIPAGTTNATFDLTILNDGVPDGTQIATIAGTAPGFGSLRTTMEIFDAQTATLQVLLPTNVVKGQGAVSGTVQVSAPVGANVSVALSSTSPNLIQVPASVVVPEGQTSAVFTATVLTDGQFNGGQTVTVTAHVQNWTDGTAAVMVEDDLNLTVSLPASAWENAGVLTNAGFVSIAVPVLTNVLITLVSSNTSKLIVPAGLTIFAGSLSNTFNVTPVDSPLVEGDQLVAVTASASGFNNGSASMLVRDKQTPPMPASPEPANLATNVPANTNLTWLNSTNPTEATNVLGGITNDVYFGTNPTLGPAEYQGTTTNTSWPLQLLAPLTTYYWQIVAHRVGSTTGAVWQFTTGGLDHFAWNNISSPQVANVPFSTTITAEDAFNSTVSNFNGTVNLGAYSQSGTILGNVPADLVLYGYNTVGYSFTPNTNLTATHVRSYFGPNVSKVSIWTAAGVLLVSQNVTNGPSSWVETPLTTPLPLYAGTTYVIGVYGLNSYWRVNQTNAFANGIINTYLSDSGGDEFPCCPSTWAGLVDLRYSVGNVAVLPVAPSVSDPFTNGVWSGNMTVEAPGSNVVLVAAQGNGHTFTSNPFNVNQIPFQPISIADSSCQKGNVETTNMLFAVTLAAPSILPVTVNYTTTDDTALAGTDYIPTNGILAFPPGSTNQTIAVAIIGNTAVESNKTFYMSLSAPVNGTLGRSQAIGTIINSNGLPGQIDHFNWTAISSPQIVNQPFAVSLTALDYFNNVATNFNGTANLSATVGLPTTNVLLGNVTYSNSNSGNYTLGYSFEPNANLTVTDVRSFSGSKVCIWSDAGLLLASQNVNSVPGTWVETPLATPLQLNAGSVYLVTFYTGGSNYYWRTDLGFSFADGVLLRSYQNTGDSFPTNTDNARWYLVDLRYIRNSVPLQVAPSNSDPFTNGVWSGNMAVQAPSTNVYLIADDGNGHTNASNPIDVNLTNDISISVAASPSPASAGVNLTYTLTVINTGPTEATGVNVTNLLPLNASFVSATSSQGTCSQNSNLVTANLGVIPGATDATISITVTPPVAGVTLTNIATVSRAEADEYLGNNVATNLTPVGRPLISIADSSCVEGNVGTTNMLFAVTLNAPSAQTVTANFATADSTALVGTDYIATNGTLTFLPGTTNQTISVAIIGNPIAQSNKTLVVDLSSPVNAFFSRSYALGTIITNGLSGLVYSFSWSAISSPQYVSNPFSATIMALDYSNNVATNFNGSVNLSIPIHSKLLMQPIQPSGEGGVPVYDFDVFGYYFTPTNNIVVTDFDYFFGSTVSLWTSTGVLLASQNVAGPTGTWNETALTTPVQLAAGSNYVVGAYLNHNYHYWTDNPPTNFADGLIGDSVYIPSDSFPTDAISQFPLVGLGYYNSGASPISPLKSGDFTNGVWSGSIAIQDAYTNVSVTADDGNGHTGSSNPFEVFWLNDISVNIATSLNPVPIGVDLTYTLTVSNTGPGDATGVMVTNLLPANVNFISATSSQGACSQSGGVVTANLGVVPVGSNPTVTIVISPTIANAALTNIATVSAAETDADPANNTAINLTSVGPPLISIADSSCVQGNIGTTNMLFTVTMNVPSAQTVTVNFATANGSALAGTNYIATNGTITFPPGTINQTVAVAIIGNTIVTSNKTLVVNLSSPVNAYFARTYALGTIINSNGLPGQIDHFDWSAILSPQYVSNPFSATITALDYSNNVATSFNGTANLSVLVPGPRTNTILSNVVATTSSSGTYTLGYSFTPDVNLTVTDVRSYSGTKVSIWTDAGVLLAAQSVSNNSGAWIETPLPTPLQLNAGSTYRVAFYTGGSGFYWRYDLTNTFADGIINQSWQSAGDSFPTNTDVSRWWFVDLQYTVAAEATPSVTPPLLDPFTNGVWSGNLAFQAPGTNVILVADDGIGHNGSSGSFNVITATPPVILVQPASQTVLGGSNVTFSVYAIGTLPLSYSWQKNTLPLAGATTTSLTLTNVVRTNSGSYDVVVTNIAGSTTSSNAILIVHVPQLLVKPTFLPDGTIVFSSSDLGGGTIPTNDLSGFKAQSSSNMVNWVDLPGALTLTNGMLQLHDVNSTNASTRFYRIIEKW